MQVLYEDIEFLISTGRLDSLKIRRRYDCFYHTVIAVIFGHFSHY